jgi:hypothetical protein
MYCLLPTTHCLKKETTMTDSLDLLLSEPRSTPSPVKVIYLVNGDISIRCRGRKLTLIRCSIFQEESMCAWMEGWFGTADRTSWKVSFEYRTSSKKH